MVNTGISMTEKHREKLEKLKEKLGIKSSSTIIQRAIWEMAEREGV